MDPNKIAVAILIMIQQWKQSKAAVKAAGDPTTETGALIEDSVLIEALRDTGTETKAHINGLIAKHTALLGN